uniref:Retrovirus-related Pol polyprotein from transposon TNT 1-94 n=1 Tax=Tanacetum cinerariifolium TaxID=118510 RepID=A0A6L2LVT7_TANCI|nr:hypothetical protein [Tanacetum cinerariifolium]
MSSSKNDIVVVGSDTHPPMLQKGSYIQWASRMKRYIALRPNVELILNSIKNSSFIFKEIHVPDNPSANLLIVSHTRLQELKYLTNTKKEQVKAHTWAISIILQGINNDVYSKFDSCGNAKEHGNSPREALHPLWWVFDETRAKVRLSQVYSHVLPLHQGFLAKEYDEEREKESKPERARETTLVLRTITPRACRQRKRVVEFEEAPNRKGGRVGINVESGRPSEPGANGNRDQGINHPLLLAAHLGRNENGRYFPDFRVNSRFIHGLRTRNLVEFLSTRLPTTYKGLMEKTYTWIEAREVANNGDLNDRKEGFNRSKKNYPWDNNRE